MLRDILESIVRWYFKRYHPTKLVNLTFDDMGVSIYEFGDVLIDTNDRHILYLGKATYLSLHK